MKYIRTGSSVNASNIVVVVNREFPFVEMEYNATSGMLGISEEHYDRIRRDSAFREVMRISGGELYLWVEDLNKYMIDNSN